MKKIAADSGTPLHLVGPKVARRAVVPEDRQQAPSLVHTTMNLTGGQGDPDSTAQPDVPNLGASLAQTATPPPPAEAAAATPRARRKKAAVGAHRPKAAPEKPRPGKKATGGKPARKAKPAPVAREGTKKETVLGLLWRAQGATLAEMMKATGWQPHSVRGFLSGTIKKRMGLKLKRSKRPDGDRVYSIRG